MKWAAAVILLSMALFTARAWFLSSRGGPALPGANGGGAEGQAAGKEERTFPEIEERLAPLATKKKKPRPGDWLAEHKEEGQTFAEYLKAEPVRKSSKLNTIYLCLIGEFTEDQKKILDLTQEFMAITFDVPVKVKKTISLSKIPAQAQRKHPSWGDHQILSSYILDEVLKPDRPKDALAYLAFTATDLWPGKGWNFVFGQASLRERTGVWSIYRKGDPSSSKRDFTKCLARTLRTATHETGHILTMYHCIVNECNINGSNNLAESDSQPLHFCPVCVRKLCWNLQVEPVAYFKKLQEFCKRNGIEEEVGWYEKAIGALEGGGP